MKAPLETALFPTLALVASLSLTTPLVHAADQPRLEDSDKREALNRMHGKPAPEMTLSGWLNSKPLEPADLKGKIVVMDFWATWCGPCIASVPKTNELLEKYRDQGVVIIGVCAPKGAEKMQATVEKHGIKYPVAVDTGGATFKAFLANSYPDYHIIDRQGNLRWGDIRNSDVETAIKFLLAEDKP